MSFRTKRIATVVFFCLTAANAQLPSTPDVSVQASYHSGSINEVGCFKYIVSNPGSNSTLVGSISLDIVKTADMADVSGVGISDGPGVSTELKNAVLQSGKAKPIIA